MRGEWALKLFNTYFDYWVGLFPSSVGTIKYMSSWTYNIEEIFHGGYSPTLYDITGDKDIVVKFVNALMGTICMCLLGCKYCSLQIYFVIGKN